MNVVCVGCDVPEVQRKTFHWSGAEELSQINISLSLLLYLPVPAPTPPLL